MVKLKYSCHNCYNGDKMSEPQASKGTGASVILPPTPCIVYFNIEVHKKVQGKRMIEVQWRQPYSVRNLSAPVFKFYPILLGKGKIKAIIAVFREPRKYIRRGEVPAREGEERTIIKFYKPEDSDFKDPYVAVITEFPERYTKMGGMDETRYSAKNELFTYITSNISSSGRHGKKLFIIIAKEVRFHHVSVSNRGNRNEYITIYRVDGIEFKDRYELSDVKVLNPYAKYAKVTDNFTGARFDALLLTYHNSVKTPAVTDHEIDGFYEEIFSTWAPSKTHYDVLFKIVKPVTLVTTRITNNGNKHVWKHMIR